MAAIVQGATGGRTGFVIGGDHEGLDVVHVGCRTGDAHRRLTRHAAVVQRVHHIGPGGSALAQFDHRDTVVVDFLEHFQCWTLTQVPAAKLRKFLAVHAIAGLTFGVEEVCIGRAFVVDSQDSTVGGLGAVFAIGADVVKVHAIVVVAHTHAPLVRLSAQIGIGGDAGDQAVTRGVQHRVGVAGWQDHVIQNAFANGGESQASSRCAAAATAACQHGQAACSHQTYAALNQTAAADLGFGQHLVKVFVVRNVGVVIWVVRHVESSMRLS